tara:strand:+ start:1494 stop:1685 length:192 start_codon:yes stop_codon:yes gene_type:complete
MKNHIGNFIIWLASVFLGCTIQGLMEGADSAPQVFYRSIYVGLISTVIAAVIMGLIAARCKKK